MVVVDTNILAYLLVEGEQTANARALFDRDDVWRSDYFILIELSNVLATMVRTRRLTPKAASAALGTAKDVMAGGMQIVDPAAALETANVLGISACDARFVTVAQALGTRLVTEDAKLRRAATPFTISLRDASP